ncbi:MAG TPA: Rad52/Rad22 family DNA repair protein [Gemmatimonadaceae bacterium]|nr:Rad52/Rad22 family DNA repair protein [Gemmatimonadaceae bacterium]
MIARHEEQSEHRIEDVWARLAAPLPPGVTAWRQDGRPIMRDGKFYARFVSYIDAQTVRERLDSVVPGEWNLTIELLPTPGAGENDFPEPAACAFKARLQILGVVREDVGTGKDYKQASTDAFKRVAVRFGIAHELYEMGQNWVQMDGDGKYAKPMEDPQAAYDRRLARTRSARENGGAQENGDGAVNPPLEFKRATLPSDVPPCPKCGGKMWDNRLGKRNPKAPDFKCRDRDCDGVIWPPKPPRSVAKRSSKREEPASQEALATADEAPAELGENEIPF